MKTKGKMFKSSRKRRKALIFGKKTDGLGPAKTRDDVLREKKKKEKRN